MSVLYRLYGRIIIGPPDAADEVPLAREHRCRRCKSVIMIRSHTRWFERWRKWLSVTRPYRCASCNWRGWIWPGTSGSCPPFVLSRPRSSAL